MKQYRLDAYFPWSSARRRSKPCGELESKYHERPPPSSESPPPPPPPPRSGAHEALDLYDTSASGIHTGYQTRNYCLHVSLRDPYRIPDKKSLPALLHREAIHAPINGRWSLQTHPSTAFLDAKATIVIGPVHRHAGARGAGDDFSH